jgi:hypothetical protein
MFNWINKIYDNLKNELHYTYETYNSNFSIDNNLQSCGILSHKNTLIEKIDIEDTSKLFCIWNKDDDKYRFIHIDEINTLNTEFKESFLHNQFLKDKYNPFLGIREYDTCSYENYLELSNLYKNGLEIKENNIDKTTHIHPIIQCASAYNMDVSPRLKHYYDTKINCFYLEGIVDDNYLKELYHNNIDYTLYDMGDYYNLFGDNDIILN